MRSSVRWHAVFAAAVVLCVAVPARGDISVGYDARLVGMGGAGLAVVDIPTQAALTNPAALSLRSGFGLQAPGVGLRARGAGLSRAVDRVGEGSVREDEAVELVRDLGKNPSSIQVSFGLGLAYNSVDLLTLTQANVMLNPGAGLSRWARTSADNDFVGWLQNQPDMRNRLTGAANIQALNQAINDLGLGADVLAAATVAPTLGFGLRVPEKLAPNVGNLYVGMRVKPTRIYYGHWTVRPDTSQVVAADFDQLGFNAVNKLGLQAEPALAMGNRDVVEQTNLGIDLGFLWQPEQYQGAAFALVVNNLIEPGFRLPDALGAPGAGTKLLPRSINVGGAFQLDGGLLVAADVVDVTGAVHGAELRAGAEYRPSVPGLRWVRLRAGLNTRTGMAAGVGLGGFNVAYASRAPLSISQTLNF